MDEAVQISAAKESCLISNLNIIKKVTIGSLRYWLQDAHTPKNKTDCYSFASMTVLSEAVFRSL